MSGRVGGEDGQPSPLSRLAALKRRNVSLFLANHCRFRYTPPIGPIAASARSFHDGKIASFHQARRFSKTEKEQDA
jgi:hypothetical protein